MKINARDWVCILRNVTISGLRWVGTTVARKVYMLPERRDTAADVSPRAPWGAASGPMVEVMENGEVIVQDAPDAAHDQYLQDLDATMAQLHRDFAVRTARIIEQMEGNHGN